MEDLSEQVFQMKTKIAQFEENEMQKSQQLETSRLENLKLRLSSKIKIYEKLSHTIYHILCMTFLYYITILL